jgi:hypothetical protein|tara:strand:+ start:880 stop:1008 length:129 start_codon:yes stop_codon:yes gene_type:complete
LIDEPLQDKTYKDPEYGLAEEWKEKNSEAFRQRQLISNRRSL